jgi:hypothetical protein
MSYSYDTLAECTLASYSHAFALVQNTSESTTALQARAIARLYDTTLNDSHAVGTRKKVNFRDLLLAFVEHAPSESGTRYAAACVCAAPSNLALISIAHHWLENMLYPGEHPIPSASRYFHPSLSPVKTRHTSRPVSRRTPIEPTVVEHMLAHLGELQASPTRADIRTLVRSSGLSSFYNHAFAALRP